jgi:CDP-diacylglycerol--glycerol-3-phosphate 3-phosphatidyltransferase
LTTAFYLIYLACCISDFLDGYIARKTNTTNKSGEVLDSIADFIFIAILLVIFVPLLSLERWMLCWVGVIATIRFMAFVIGYVKYRVLPFLHTYGNKITGIALACFPILYHSLGLTVTAFILCGLASLSAIEELFITIRSKELNRNIIGILSKPTSS